MKNLLFIGLLSLSTSMLWAQTYCNNEPVSYVGKEDSVFVMNEDPAGLEADNVTTAERNDPEFVEIEEEIDSDPFYEEEDVILMVGERADSTVTLAKAINPKGKALTEAYYRVGEQYEKRGKRTKGATFKKRAELMDPNFQPSKDDSDEIHLSPRGLATQELKTQGTVGAATAVARPTPIDEDTQIKVVTFQFDRLVRGLLSNNLEVLDKLFGGTVEVNDQTLEHSDIMAALAYAFDQGSLAEVAPSALYTSKPLISLLGDNSGVVTVTAAERGELRSLPFWKKNQELHFHKQNGKWMLTKIIAND